MGSLYLTYAWMPEGIGDSVSPSHLRLSVVSRNNHAETGLYSTRAAVWYKLRMSSMSQLRFVKICHYFLVERCPSAFTLVSSPRDTLIASTYDYRSETQIKGEDSDVSGLSCFAGNHSNHDVPGTKSDLSDGVHSGGFT